MLADISNVDAIYIVCGRTDMRKSIDGLCAIIQEQFSMEIDHSLYRKRLNFRHGYKNPRPHFCNRSTLTIHI